MKLSLKEFFVHEAKSSAKGSEKKSSINIDVKSSAQVNIKEAEECVDEKALSSYKHPTTHLAKKFAGKKGVRDPWALAQHVKQKAGVDEGSINEYEDPTSSKHDQGDSKWSSPMSHKKGVPHEVPHSGAQSRSSDAWKGMRRDMAKTSSHSDLKRFFGGEFKPVEEAGEDYEPGRVQRVGHPGDEPMKGQVGWAVTGGAEPEVFNDYEEAYAYAEEHGGEVIPAEDLEVPMGSMDDFGNVGGDEDYDDEGEYQGKIGRGREPHQPDWTQTTAFNDDEPIRAHEAAEPEDDEEFEKFMAGLDEPKAAGKEEPKADEPEIDWSQLDDEDFIAQLAASDKGPELAPIPPKAPKAPKMKDVIKAPDYSSKYDFSRPEPKDKGQFWRDIEAEDGESMDWDELRATEPEVAADIEREYPDIADPGTFMDEPGGVKRERGVIFTKNKAGDIIMRHSGTGGRSKWDPHAKEWISMDDGGTPAGEF